MARRIMTKYNNINDSEKLLEEIIVKRLVRQKNVKNVTSKVSFKLPKTIEKKSKEEQNILENDKIYEQIIKKKQARLSKIKENNSVKTEVIIDKNFQFKKNFYRRCLNKSLIVLSCLLVLIFIYIFNNYTYSKYEKNNDEEFEYVESYFVRKDPKYISCMNSVLDSNVIEDEMKMYIEQLNEYLSQYKTSVLYYDLTNNFKYTYGEDINYYAASVAKMVVALYIYRNASDGLINLDDTIIYQRKYRDINSIISTKYNYGTRITIRELVAASILVSDNSAHNMLVDYIGKNRIIAFGHSLGASYTLDSDTYGHINVNDAYYYLRALNEYLNSPGELNLELKQLFLNADENNLNLDNLNVFAAQKYGHYAAYYHNIGIMYDKHPYLLAILSLEGVNDDIMERINNISQEIYQLHLRYYNVKENYCINNISK